MDPYKVLGISRKASAAEIKAAYRKMSAKYHPDVGGDAWAFEQVKEAYEQLMEGGDSEPSLPVPAPQATAPPKENAPNPEIDLVTPTPARRRRKRKRGPNPELIGIVAGAICALVVGGIFVAWLGNQKNNDSGSLTKSAKQGSQEAAHRNPPRVRRPVKEKPETGVGQLPPGQVENLPRQVSPTVENIVEVVEDQSHKIPTTKPSNPDDSRSQIRDWHTLNGQLLVRGKLALVDDPVVFLIPEQEEVKLAELAPLESMTKIPVVELSDVDRDFLGLLDSVESQLPQSANGYRALERELVRTKKIVSFYELELERKNISDELRQFFLLRIAELSPHAENDELIVGSEFLNREEIDDLRQQSDELLNEWQDLLFASNGDVKSDMFKRAQQKMQQARKLDPISIRPDFYLGLASIFIGRDFKKAGSYFDKCVQKGRTYRSILNGPDTISFANALNNSALLLVRRNQLKSAEKLWREMYRVIPYVRPEVAHNIQRVGLFIEKSQKQDASVLQADSKTRDVFLEWRAELFSENLLPESPTSSLGWIYLQFATAKSNSTARTQTQSSSSLPIGLGTGVLIAPGKLLTNAQVLGGEESARIQVKVSLGAPGESYEGTILAVSKKLNLAIIECPGIEAQHASLRAANPGIGETVVMAGYPLSRAGKFGHNRVSILSEVANGSDSGDLLVINGAANRGHDGGPVFDEKGSLLGILTLGRANDVFDERFSAAVSISDASEFLRKHAPEVSFGVPKKDTTPEQILATYDKCIFRVETSISVESISSGLRMDELAGARKYMRGLEEKICFICDGSARGLKCPNNSCVRGKVKVPYVEWVPNPNGTKRPVKRVRLVDCPNCSGNGYIDCGACTRGIQDF